MKPRLRLVHGIWTCRGIFRLSQDWVMGHGYTPAEAYRDWEAQWKQS